MARSAYLPIAADRYEACVRTVQLRGLDLRDSVFRSQVRLVADTPGAPLVDLMTVTNGNAEGVRLVDFSIVDGLPVTTIEIVINETTMEGLPYSGELGSATVLAYDLQATIKGRKRKLFGGQFVVLAGVTGADNAPTSRSLGYGCSSSSAGSSWSTAALSFSDEGATVVLSGLDLLDDVFAGLIANRQDVRARMEARGLLYGITNANDARLFAAEATELAFADDYYRTGFVTEKLASMVGWETSGSPPIDGRGLFISGNGAAGILRPTNGDVTVIVEADMPAYDATTKVLASYVGSALSDNVNIIRSDTGIYAMQLVRQGQGTLQVVGPTDLSARRMRVAFSIGSRETRVSFAGGNVLTIVSLPPVQLLRLWFGRLALGNGNPLEGYITRAGIFPHTVSNSLLQAMSGGSVTDDEVTQLIDQKIRTHDNNNEAHELEALRRQAELADSKTGLWSVKAADTFAGADGTALGNAETGGMAWTSPAGLVRKTGRVQHPTGGYGGAWLQSGAKDGQVEADLYPGTKEASLYVRLNAATTQWILLQRNADGGITLNIQIGTTIRLAPLLSVPVVAGERFKVRFVGPRIWVFRGLAGVETLLFDVTEPRLMSETIHGVRLDGGGSADNFRVLNREAL